VITVVDYGVGNLRSVQKALEQVGAEAVVTEDSRVIQAAQGVILPGVGAFGDAMDTLRATGLDVTVREVVKHNIPLLGICLGMQLLFDESEEMGRHQGLGVLPGRTLRFGAGLKVPHIGWNCIRMVRPGGLLSGVTDGDFAYFVHSYYVAPEQAEIVLATTDYGLDFASVVEQGRIFGIQFHPEKSQDVGLRILRNFAEVVKQA